MSPRAVSQRLQKITSSENQPIGRQQRVTLRPLVERTHRYHEADRQGHLVAQNHFVRQVPG